MKAVHRSRAALRSVDAPAFGLRLWWAVPAWSIVASQQILGQGWRMLAERQGVLMQAQLRLAWLPWLLAAHAMGAAPPRSGPDAKAAPAALMPARSSRSPAEPSRRQVGPVSGVVRLRLVR